MKMSLSRSFSSFFSRRHRDEVGGMQVSIDEWCPNPLFYLGRAVSLDALDGLGIISAYGERRTEEEDEDIEQEEEEEEDIEEEEEEEEMKVAEAGVPSSPGPSRKVRRWWQRVLALCCFCCYEVDD